MWNIGSSNNSESKHLLGLVCKKFTGKQLGDLKKKTPPETRRLLRDLPQYTINDKYQKIVEADYYLQWVEEGDEEYILFDLVTSDQFLVEELSYVSVGDGGSVIENEDEELLISIIKNHADINDPNVILPSPEYIIINIRYFGGGYPDYEWDVEYEIEGFINRKLETIKFNLDERSK